MEKVLLYKEWLKTRRIYFIALTLSVALALYAVLMINRLIELKGMDHLWLIMLLKDNTFVDIIKYSPMIVGIAVAAAQMIPEISQNRLKLTLHLPYSQSGNVMWMLGTGLAEVMSVFIIQLGIIVIYDSTVLPGELVSRVALTTMPWYLAGLASYLLVSAICLEGVWLRRIILVLISISFMMVLFLHPAPEAYNNFILIIFIFTLLLSILSFGSVIRFKEGRQE